MLCSDGVKKKGVVFPSILFLFFLAVCFVISPSAEGAFFVTPEGAGNEDGSSWEHAYGEKDLQTAVDAAAVGGGGEVWVAAGVYRPSLEGDQNVSFTLKTGVALYGGFSGTESHRSERDWEENLTVLTGDLDNNDEGKVYGVTVSADQIVGDNSKTVVKAGNIDDTAILDGFTVCGGNNNLFDRGGGMHNGSGSPRVINCTFIGNATRKGGGVYNDSGSPEIANCTFTGNAASWRGGGMCNWSGSARVINCTFTDNAIGMYGGGMHNETGSPRAVNCTFVGNTAGEFGGGMYNYFGFPEIVSCTFTGNGAQKGGGMYNRQNPLKVINCIFWGNNATVDGNEIHVAGGSVTVSYSAVKGGYPGTENTDVDPNLGVLGNYGGPTEICPISPVSSAINKGSWDVTLRESISRDQRGIPRDIVSPDMGAYEYRRDLALLRVRTRGSGTVTRSAAGTPLGTVSDEWYYDEDTVVKLTAVPGDNWIFTGWNGDVTGTENPESVTLGGNTFTAVTALFARQYTITATAGTGGTIEPSGEVGVLAGEDQTFTITPASGYSVEKVLVDGLSGGKLTSYTFTGVTGDHGIEAVFSHNPAPNPTPSITPSPEPSVTPSPEPSPSPYPTPDPDIPLPEITLTVTLVGGGEILSGPLEIPLTPELLQALLLENWMSPEEFENLLSEGYNSDLFSLFSLGARLAEGDAELTLLVEITVGDLPGGYAYKIYLLASTWDDKGNPAGFSSLVHAPENGMLRKRDTTETWRITISDNGSMDGNPAKRYVDAEIGGVVVAYPLEEPPVSGSGGGCSQGRFSGLAFLFLPLMFFLRKR